MHTGTSALFVYERKGLRRGYMDGRRLVDNETRKKKLSKKEKNCGDNKTDMSD